MSEVHVPTLGVLEQVDEHTGERLRAVMAGPRAWIRDLAVEQLLGPGFEALAVLPGPGLSLEEHRERTMAQLRSLAGSDLVTIGFPPEVGGKGDVGAFATGFQMLTYGDVSLQVKVGVHVGLFGGAIQHLGTALHHQRFLPGVLDVSLPGCFAMTETGHGSDVASLRTTATYETGLDDTGLNDTGLDDTGLDDTTTGHFVLHTPDRTAWKDYIGNAAEHGQWAVVFAQLVTGGPDEEPSGHGVHAFLVQLRDDDGAAMPGVAIGDDGRKLGLHGVDNGRLAFDHVVVPREALLDRFGQVGEDGTYTSPIENPDRRFFTMLGTLVQGRVAVSGAGVAASKLAMTIALRHAYTRTQFEGAVEGSETLLMDYLTHQRRLLPRAARSFALHFLQEELVDEFHAVFTASHDVRDDEVADQARRRLEARAAGTKAISTWHATDSIQEAREACGGFGYLSENRLAQLKADMDVFTTFEGDNTVLMQLLAKSLLGGFREDLDARDLPGTIMFGIEQVVDEVLDRTRGRQLLSTLRDAVARRDSDTAVIDRDWQREMLAARAKDTLTSLALRLRALLADGRSSVEAFIFVQDHVLTVAWAQMELDAFEAFDRAVAASTDPGVRELLSALCDLHALATIERDRAWWLEHGYLTSTRSKAIVGTVNGLLRDLRPYVPLLARSMGVPDELVGAPIALRHHGETYLDARQRLGHGPPDDVARAHRP